MHINSKYYWSGYISLQFQVLGERHALHHGEGGESDSEEASSPSGLAPPRTQCATAPSRKQLINHRARSETPALELVLLPARTRQTGL